MHSSTGCQTSGEKSHTDFGILENVASFSLFFKEFI